MPSKANTYKKTREDKLSLQNQVNNDNDWVDPSELSTPRLIALYNEQDRLFKEENERQKRLRKIARQIKAENEKMTQARVQSAREYQRDQAHAMMLKRASDIEAEEKHFDARVKPKKIEKLLKPTFSCDAIFYRLIKDEDDNKYKSTIKRDGKRY